VDDIKEIVLDQEFHIFIHVILKRPKDP